MKVLNAILHFVFFLSFFVQGCNEPQTAWSERGGQEDPGMQLLTPVNGDIETATWWRAGDNLYYISETQGRFVDEFIKFQSAYPDLRVVSVWGNGYGTHGRDTGYYILVEKY